MSDAKAWNLDDVAKFKKAFGARNNFRMPLIGEPPYNAAAGFSQACAMLTKRRAAAEQTFTQVKAERTAAFGADNAMLTGLQAVRDDLATRTDAGLGRDMREHHNDATQRMVALTDEWIAFEARCISANNEMGEGVNDAGVRKKLARRATGLQNTLAGFDTAGEHAPAIGDLGTLVNALVLESAAEGATIADPAAFAKRLEAATKRVRDAGNAATQSLECDIDPVSTLMLPDAMEKWEELQQLQLKQLYGIEATTTPIHGMQPGPFPYNELLEVLAMVPLDHSMSKALKTVTREYVSFSDGGDYAADTQTIRINPVLEWTGILDWLPARDIPGAKDTGVYKDPATGAKMRINAWKACALHEIGHAVDAAHGIMAKHQGKPGCGEWTQVDPAEFVPQYPAFLQALRVCGVADPTFQANVGNAQIKAAFAKYALGTKTVDDTRAAFRNAWTGIYLQNDALPFNARAGAPYPIVTRIGQALDAVFPNGRGALAADQARITFLAQATARQDLDDLTTGAPRVFDPAAFWRQFEELAVTPAKPAQDLKRWMQMQTNQFGRAIDDLITADREPKLTRWTNAAVTALPPLDPRTLATFRAAAEPWNRDISGETIGAVAAAQEAYPGDALWWRYSSADRGGTSVSSYQWRAPGEWFAELYAVTWFKKVEPPGPTGKDVRPFLYGGSITPDAA